MYSLGLFKFTMSLEGHLRLKIHYQDDDPKTTTKYWKGKKLNSKVHRGDSPLEWNSTRIEVVDGKKNNEFGSTPDGVTELLHSRDHDECKMCKNHSKMNCYSSTCPKTLSVSFPLSSLSNHLHILSIHLNHPSIERNGRLFNSNQISFAF